jgi:hypothetical protein
MNGVLGVKQVLATTTESTHCCASVTVYHILSILHAHTFTPFESSFQVFWRDIKVEGERDRDYMYLISDIHERINMFQRKRKIK